MSCEIRVVANILDIPAVRRCLFPTDDLRGGDNWLHSCKISVSPAGNVIVIAREKRVVVLKGNWDSERLQIYQISFSGCLNEDDVIKSVLCLPVINQKQRLNIDVDWTCIAIGYESGYLRLYTENCSLLLEEQLHNESIVSIKCQSQHSPRPDINFELKPEEIYIQYVTCICIINGPNLFALLNNCKKQLNESQLETSLLSTNPKKWGFSDQAAVNDAAIIGLDLTNTFNHLLTATICGGFDTKYRTIPPHNNLVLAVGTRPYVGFHYATEGVVQPVLSDVAKAVTNKLKSAISGWLTGTKSQPEKQSTLVLQPAEQMVCRFGLCDLRRSGERVILTPNRKLAAVSDALGRVLLVDTYKGIATRIFKGYRDAQCAFIQVPDEKKTKHKAQRAVALFLVIYSPKKGTVEIFSAQQGNKIVTFTASKHSLLLYIGHGLFGFTTTSKSDYVCQYTTLLIDADGQMKEIVIPFHYALSEKNSKRARDLHLYKRLKHIIRIDECDLEKLTQECVNTCAELKTIDMKLQCLNMLINSKELHANIILQCCEQFLDDVKEEDEDGKSILTLVKNLIRIIKFYNYVILNNDDKLDIENGNSHKENNITLSINPKDKQNLQRLLDLGFMMENKELKVCFLDKKDYNVVKFISVFNLENEGRISLKEAIDENDLYQTSEIIFKKYILQNLCSPEFKEEILKSNIVIKDLFKLIITYWVNRPLKLSTDLEMDMNNFHNVLYTLTTLIDVQDHTIPYDDVSPFWSGIRDLLVNSSRSFPALMAAILCKNIASKIETEKNCVEPCMENVEDDLDVWEQLSQENCQWTLLIGKLEDISLLNIMISSKPVYNNPVLPKLIHQHVDISLKYILEKGKGSVSELVAQWISSGGVSTEDILLHEKLYEELEEEDKQSQEQEKEMEQSPIFTHLNILRRQFPYSMSASILLANMCWEYALAWQKDIQNILLLEASIQCLKSITNLNIKQGLFNLVWNTHLKILFESTCKLINKVGKLPKERLCRQDTGLTDYQITLFINLCADFFDTFMNVTHDCYNVEKTQLQFEPFWENGNQPLVELAINQNEINYDLLHLHYQLSLTIQMIVTFAIKHQKFVSNLFDLTIMSLFFTDLQQKMQINWNKFDAKMNASRIQFLIKVIAASIETVTRCDNKVYSTDHVYWMSKAIYLARFWCLDLDLLRRYQIVTLYTNGFDELADELIPVVNEIDKLGPDLLIVAAKRLSNYLSTTDDLAEKITAFSPQLTAYIDNCKDGWCAPCTLEAILSLITQCIKCLQEDKNEYKLAALMLEACSTLQDLSK